MRWRVALVVWMLALVAGCGDSATTTPASTTSTTVTRASTKPAPTTISSATSAPTTGVGAPTFAPASVTFVSPETGWLLDTADCCVLRLWQTRDGGATWKRVNGPPITRSSTDGATYSVRFANLNDGYVFGKSLWTTHDGGANWLRVAYPHLGADTYVDRLEIAGGTAYALINPFEVEYRDRLISTPVGRVVWTDLFAWGQDAAPVKSGELVAQGDRAYALFNFRVLAGGAIATGGTANQWQPPCLGTLGPAVLAASSPTEVVVVCNEGVWGGTPARSVQVSHDGGTTFAATARPLTDRLGSGECVATSSPTTIVVGGSGSAGAPWQLVATFDGGTSWQPVWTSNSNRTAGCYEIGFTTSTQGVAIVGGQEPALLMTRDGGHSWQRIGV
jgi:hypothetical protein